MLNRNNKPTELQRYKKNTKQKKILIGTIVLFVLVLGGIKLYRTFALYKEEKSFNVLKGIVPDFHTYYKESILNGAYPELKGDLIPVTIDEEGTVRKADINEPWYSYEKQEWANAIIKQNSYDALNAYGKVSGATKEKDYVSLDGVDDYIDLGLENHDFGNTISLVIRLSFNSISGTELLTNPEKAGVELLLYQQKFAFSIYDKNENIYHYYATDITPELNTMYTIVGTYNGKEMKLYLNGNLVLNEKIETVIKPSSAQFCIGANDNPSIFSHIGFTNIDVYQAAIFDRALTEEEIESDFSNEIKIHDNSELLKYVDFTEREEEAEEIIPEDIIESYFVWIPKYRYKIFNMGEYNNLVTTKYEEKSKPIEIKFGLTNTIEDEDECVAPPSGEKGTCSINKWMTHPAFTAFDTKGIWVGKFETGYNGANSTTDAQQDKIETDKIIIKPNEYSWRNLTVGKMYQNSIDYDKDLNSHMMKNTEWGAVAYLTNSIYGRCSGNECIDIRINNNQSRLTGYAGIHEPTTGYTGTNESCINYSQSCNEYGTSEKGKDGTYNYQYFNSESVIASTTGNYTGIYDMSGGSWEYVMGVMVDEDGKPIYKNSELSEDTLKDKKYYDAYKYNTKEYQYSNRILGDATGEMGPFILEQYTGTTSEAQIKNEPISGWYHDQGWFVSGSSWFDRGGYFNGGFESGVFTFNKAGGGPGADRAFRIVLAF